MGVDLIWLIIAVAAIATSDGLYRRIRYRMIRRRRKGTPRPVVVLSYISGHLTRL